MSETPYDKLCSPQATVNDSELLKSITIEGTDEFLAKANLLVQEHSGRFRSSLTSEAARLKSFDLELQPESNWYTNRQNKLPKRLQSPNKRNATREVVINALTIRKLESNTPNS